MWQIGKRLGGVLAATVGLTGCLMARAGGGAIIPLDRGGVMSPVVRFDAGFGFGDYLRRDYAVFTRFDIALGRQHGAETFNGPDSAFLVMFETGWRARGVRYAASGGVGSTLIDASNRSTSGTARVATSAGGALSWVSDGGKAHAGPLWEVGVSMGVGAYGADEAHVVPMAMVGIWGDPRGEDHGWDDWK